MRYSLSLLVPVLSVALGFAQETKPLAFHLTFDQKLSAAPFSGRVYVMLSQPPLKELPGRPNWFKPEPFLAVDAVDWRPGQPLIVADKALAFPAPLFKLPRATYSVQAVMDFDRTNGPCITAAGNGYSAPIRLELAGSSSGPIKLHLDRQYPGKNFKETERVKLVDIESKLLSAFHRRPIRLRAGVVLPKSFAQDPKRRYPVVYEIPGFSGTHYGAFAAETRNATAVDGVEVLYVVLDPGCRLGHHVFADSDNNGPCGQALCTELIPHIEQAFRGLGQAAGRLVTGHSSGGWSSLWLQITYPEVFGGVWSTAPDPVDFRDFQLVNIYQPGINVFHDEQGRLRPLGRRAGKVLFHYKPFSDMETVMGRSGQLFSFEAVFGPRGADGQPKPLWHRQSGLVDPAVARTWERYDIRLVLERNWARLGPKLSGKLHVYMGAEDNFYLEGATRLLQESLKKLGSDAVVEIFPGRDHGSLLDRNLRERIAREMAAQLRKPG